MTLLPELGRHNADTELFALFMENIKAATYPWRPLKAVAFTEYDIDKDLYHLVVEVYFGKQSCWLYWFQMYWNPAADEQETAFVFGKEFERTFREWRQEPDHNIVLGEN